MPNPIQTTRTNKIIDQEEITDAKNVKEIKRIMIAMIAVLLTMNSIIQILLKVKTLNN